MNATPFTVFVGLHPTYVSLCLQGNCCGTEAATHLEGSLLGARQTRGVREVWLDCQQLAQLDASAQRVLLQASWQLDAAGVRLYVCGLPTAVQTQLEADNLAPLLHLRPATDYRGFAPVRTWGNG